MYCLQQVTEPPLCACFGVALSLCLAKLFVAVTINKFRIHIIIKCSCVVCVCLNLDKFVVAFSFYHAVYLLCLLNLFAFLRYCWARKMTVCVCISWEHLRAHECLHLQMENEVNFQPGGADAVWKFAIHFVRGNCADYKLEMREAAIVVCNVKPGFLRWWKLKWSWQVKW